MPLHVTTLSWQSSRNYHLPPDWDLHSPINILTLRNPYVQSVRSLSPRKGNSHFETSKLQVVGSAHIQENQLPLVEVTARVFFCKTTNINLASPTSTFSHLHSDDVHAVGGLSDFTTRPRLFKRRIALSNVWTTRARGPFLESSDNFSGPKSCSMFAVFAFKISLNNFENNKVKLSVNEAKLTGFWTTCRNWAFW